MELLQRHVAPGAFHNSGERYDPPKCHPHTRRAVLTNIMDYGKPDSLKPDSQARFWNGMSRPSASACDAVARDFEHFIFKVKIVMSM